MLSDWKRWLPPPRTGVVNSSLRHIWVREMRAEAMRLGIRGWVRNRRDGSVEALFVGARRQIDSMVEACRRGPPAARVEHIVREPASDDGSMGFRQAPTV